MLGCVKIADWKKITNTAVARAKAGDAKARQWLSDYIYGKPVQRVNADITANGALDVLLRWSDDDDQHNASSST
jgi:hypothetical protein